MLKIKFEILTTNYFECRITIKADNEVQSSPSSISRLLSRFLRTRDGLRNPPVSRFHFYLQFSV